MYFLTSMQQNKETIQPYLLENKLRFESVFEANISAFKYKIKENFPNLLNSMDKSN